MQQLVVRSGCREIELSSPQAATNEVGDDPTIRLVAELTGLSHHLADGADAGDSYVAVHSGVDDGVLVEQCFTHAGVVALEALDQRKLTVQPCVGTGELTTGFGGGLGRQ